MNNEFWPFLSKNIQHYAGWIMLIVSVVFGFLSGLSSFASNIASVHGPLVTLSAYCRRTFLKSWRQTQRQKSSQAALRKMRSLVSHPNDAELQDLINDPEVVVIILQGENGTGKSHMVDRLCMGASSNDVSLFGCKPKIEPIEPILKLQDILESLAVLGERYLSLAQSNLSAELKRQQIITLLRQHKDGKTHILCFDNYCTCENGHLVQWIQDEHIHELIKELAEYRVAAVRIVITCHVAPAFFHEKMRGAVRLSLQQPLNAEEIEILKAANPAINNLSTEVIKEVCLRSNHNRWALNAFGILSRRMSIECLLRDLPVFDSAECSRAAWACAFYENLPRRARATFLLMRVVGPLPAPAFNEFQQRYPYVLTLMEYDALSIRGAAEAEASDIGWYEVHDLMQPAVQKALGRGCLRSLRRRAYRHHAKRFYRDFAKERIGKLRTVEETGAFDELRSTIPNMRALTSQGRSDKGFHFFTQLDAELALFIGMFLERCGHLSDATRTVNEGLCLTRKNRGALRVDLLLVRASLGIDEHNWSEAHQHLDVAEQLPRGGRNTARAHNLRGAAYRGEARSLQDEGEIRRTAQEETAARNAFERAAKLYAGAREAFEKSLALFKAIPDDVQAAIVLSNLGLLEDEDAVGDKSKALDHLHASLEIRLRKPDQRGLAETYTNLGICQYRQGRQAANSLNSERLYQESQETHKQALQIEQSLANTDGVARSLYNMGEVAIAQGTLVRAYSLLTAAEHLWQEVGSPNARTAAKDLRDVQASLTSRVIIVPAANLKGRPLNEVIAWARDAEEVAG